jgi:hypothetical protein
MTDTFCLRLTLVGWCVETGFAQWPIEVLPAECMTKTRAALAAARLPCIDNCSMLWKQIGTHTEAGNQGAQLDIAISLPISLYYKYGMYSFEKIVRLWPHASSAVRDGLVPKECFYPH